MDLQIDQRIQQVRTKHQGCLIVISGPSGVGKGTLVKAVLPRFQDLTLSVSMTTRGPRVGEQQGVNYFFESSDAFQALIKESAFLEYAEYNGNFYGTPQPFVLEQLQMGRDVILEIDVQGAAQIRRNWPNRVVTVFILPPGEAELKTRLEQRRTESAVLIQQRLAKVAKEVEQLPYYDYFIVNDALETAVDDLAAIIRAERLKINRTIEE